MSVEKLKIFKKLKGSEAYSHNPIIDSLIRQKLSSEMAVVKDSFNTIVKQDDTRQREAQSQERNSLRKRRISQSITGLTIDKVKDSLGFTPVSRELISFVTERQNASPFLSEQQAAAVGHARSHSEDFVVRIKGRDKIDYSQQQLGQEMTERVRRSVPGDVWMPSSVQVQEVLTQRESQEGLEEPFRLSLTQKSQTLLSPLKSSRISSSTQLTPPPSQVASYPTKRYHKNDYLALDQWLTSSVDELNKKAMPDSLIYHFNQIYGVYMSSLKELIRLTYVQSAEKGVLIEKIIWSLVRLFEQLLTQQHRILSRDFREYSQEIKDLHELYSTRMTKLEERLSQTEQKLDKSEHARKEVSLACLSFNRVNKEMRDEIGRFGATFKTMEREKDYLTDKLEKLVIEFEKREVVRLQRTSTHLVYFFVNDNNKPQTIAKIPREETLTRHFKAQMVKAAEGKIVEALDPLQNDLTGYWEKKKDFFQIDRIMYEHILGSVTQTGTQADGEGPAEKYERGIQCPEGDEETFEQYFKRQMKEEREIWQQKQQQLNTKTISLGQLYEQARQAITMLTTQNTNYRDLCQKKDHEVEHLRKKVEQAEEKCTLLNKKITTITNEKNDINKESDRLRRQITDLTDRVTEGKKKYLYEIENNNLLVTKSLELQNKLTESQSTFEQLDERIRFLVPHFQALMKEEDAHPLMTTLTTQLLEHLSDYVEKDAKVFLTH